MGIILTPGFRGGGPAKDEPAAGDGRRGRRRRQKLRRRAREERCRRLLEASPCAVIVTDDTGAITDWSQRASDLLGWQRTAVIERRLHELLVGISLEAVVQSAIGGGIQGGELLRPHTKLDLKLLHQDGRAVPVTATVCAVVGGAGELAVAFFLEPQLALEVESLHGHQEALEAAILGCAGSAFFKDTSGILRIANAAFAAHLALSLPEIIGNHHSRWLGDESSRTIDRMDRDVLHSGEPRSHVVTVTLGGQHRTDTVLKTPYRGRSGRLLGLVGILHPHPRA